VAKAFASSGTHLERVPQPHLDPGPKLPHADHGESPKRVRVLLWELCAPLLKLAPDTKVGIPKVIRPDVPEQAGQAFPQPGHGRAQVGRSVWLELVVGPGAVVRRGAALACGTAGGPSGGKWSESFYVGEIVRGWRGEGDRNWLACKEGHVVGVVAEPPAGHDLGPLALDGQVIGLNLLKRGVLDAKKTKGSGSSLIGWGG